MEYDVYILRGYHEQLGFFTEYYFSYDEALKAFEFYADSFIPVSLFGENTKTYYGKLLLSYRIEEVR